MECVFNIHIDVLIRDVLIHLASKDALIHVNAVFLRESSIFVCRRHLVHYSLVLGCSTTSHWAD